MQGKKVTNSIFFGGGLFTPLIRNISPSIIYITNLQFAPQYYLYTKSIVSSPSIIYIKNLQLAPPVLFLYQICSLLPQYQFFPLFIVFPPSISSFPYLKLVPLVLFILYVQEVVTQPKILNRTIFFQSNSCDLILFCSVTRIIFNSHFLMQIYYNNFFWRVTTSWTYSVPNVQFSLLVLVMSPFIVRPPSIIFMICFPQYQLIGPLRGGGGLKAGPLRKNNFF